MTHRRRAGAVATGSDSQPCSISRRQATWSATLCALGIANVRADSAAAPGSRAFIGRLQVQRVAPGDPRVRAMILFADDGNRYVLDPSENGRPTAALDGVDVEILGYLQQGYGGGPFLHLRSIRKIR